MNLFWSLSDKGTRFRFCWIIPSHCGIGRNERVDQLAKQTLDQDIDPLASVYYRFGANGQRLYSAVGSNQVGCSCTWQRSLSCETNTGATEEIQAINQSCVGCNHPASSWPYQGHQVPYLVPRTAKCLPLLWSSTDHWPYASEVCSVQCAVLHECRDEYYTTGSLNALFETIPEKWDYSIWYERPDILFHYSFEPPRGSDAVC